MKCPGQDSRYWGPEAIFEASCPECGGPIEFFKDESSRKCRSCGHKLLNPKIDFGCAAYCKFAEQCVGELTPELMAKRSDLLKDRVAAEVKRNLGRDFKRIGRALKVVDYAYRILRAENTDPAAPMLAAYLLALSDQRGERDTKETALETAAGILERTGAPEVVSREALKIVENLWGGRVLDSPGFKCVFDADRIAAIGKTKQSGPAEELPLSLDEVLFTKVGRELAAQLPA